ncbi:MAG: hypothetical protein JRH11_03435 [Deltaproteobacteria bacterium]|nr:hypothetical protein [Deltaproteobacteria bacterium]
MRARLVTTGGGEEQAPLTLAIELENISDEGIDLHWRGPPHGFATFYLDDETGAEVPEPPWRLGGNEPGGDLLEHIAVHTAVRTELGEIIARFDSEPIVRIGAFWARELPPAGTRRVLRARITGRAPVADEVYVARGDDNDTVIRSVRPNDPRGRVWTGPLEVPGICVAATTE